MDFEAARAKMVDNQIRTTDVTSHSVLTAFLTVPREDFVPEKAKMLAYIDNDVEISAAAPGKPARFLMEASPLAKLLQLAAIGKDDFVLEVGCGTGYTSALLSIIAGSVIALECDEALAAEAKAKLSGYGKVEVVTGPLEKGYAAGAPYDLIFVNGAVEEVPAALLGQLRDAAAWSLSKVMAMPLAPKSSSPNAAPFRRMSSSMLRSSRCPVSRRHANSFSDAVLPGEFEQRRHRRPFLSVLLESLHKHHLS